jgi:superoxide dismutase, Cu-Zn family
MRPVTTRSMLIAVASITLGAGAGCNRDQEAATGNENLPQPLALGPIAAAGTHFRQAILHSAAGQEVARVTWVRARGAKVGVFASVAFAGIRHGFHGIHIHANDNPANGAGCVADPAAPANTHFVSADGHYNPGGVVHGGHGGDMPNVLVLDDGTATLSFVGEVDLDDIAGRAMILHEGVDNHGNVPVGAAPNQYTANSPEAVTLTNNTGNAGNRLACGLIR